MADTLKLDRSRTALLVMDFQRMIVEGHASGVESLLGHTARLLKAARAAQTKVIYVAVGFRTGYPEVSDRNLSFASIKQTGRFAPDDAQAAIHPDVAPQGNEPVVTKHRVGAFSGTDLQMLLRAGGIDTLVLTGIATSGVVLSTLRYAADADYRLIAVRDCCGDMDPQVHEVLMDKVFPHQAQVASADQVIKALT